MVESFIPKIKTESIDLVIADPPFNLSKKYDNFSDNIKQKKYLENCDFWIKHCFRVLKSTGCLWIYCSSNLLYDFLHLGKKYGKHQNTIVWKYANPIPDKKRFQKTWSPWLLFSKSDNFTFNDNFSKSIESITKNRKNLKTPIYDIWEDIPKLVGGFLAQPEVILKPNTKKRLFVYQLPILLLKRIISYTSSPGEIVLDLFSHSGTTSYTAKLLKRNFIAVEQSKFYCDTIKKRLNKNNKGFLHDF